MPDRPQALLIALALAGAAAGCGPSAEGIRAYEEGRYTQARSAFDAAVRAAGEEAPPALLWNRALASLRTGALDAADADADAAAARGGPEFAARRDFLKGNTAWSRCDAADAESRRPGAAPLVLDRAVAHAEVALLSWERAAAGPTDWPAARRNAERAVLRLEELRGRQEMEKAKDRGPGAPPRPPPRRRRASLPAPVRPLPWNPLPGRRSRPPRRPPTRRPRRNSVARR